MEPLITNMLTQKAVNSQDRRWALTGKGLLENVPSVSLYWEMGRKTFLVRNSEKTVVLSEIRQKPCIYQNARRKLKQSQQQEKQKAQVWQISLKWGNNRKSVQKRFTYTRMTGAGLGGWEISKGRSRSVNSFAREAGEQYRALKNTRELRVTQQTATVLQQRGSSRRHVI